VGEAFQIRSNVDADSNCDFCTELDGRKSYFSGLYGDRLRDRLIIRTRYFSVFPTIGQIVPDYLLIISNAHFTASAQLPNEQSRELDDLTLILFT